MNYTKETVYIITRYYSDGLPYSDCGGTETVTVCDTKELAEYIAQETDNNIFTAQFTDDDWRDWECYVYDNFCDDDGESEFDNYDNTEDFSISRAKELEECAYFFKTNKTELVTHISYEQLKDKIIKHWHYLDQYWVYGKCEISEITILKEIKE